MCLNLKIIQTEVLTSKCCVKFDAGQKRLGFASCWFFFEREVNSASLSLWMTVLSSQKGTVDGIATPTTAPVTSSARRITLRLASRRKGLKSPLPPIPLSTWMVSEGGQAEIVQVVEIGAFLPAESALSLVRHGTSLRSSASCCGVCQSQVLWLLRKRPLASSI